MLLVLDNCEHVIEAAAALAVDTLRGCRACGFWRPAASVTHRGRTRAPSVTARKPSHSEAAFRCRGSQLPGRLFVERAAATMNEFELTDADAAIVAEICENWTEFRLRSSLQQPASRSPSTTTWSRQSRRIEPCQRQGKWPDRTLDHRSGCPGVPVAVRTSRLSSREEGKAIIFTPVRESSGESQLRSCRRSRSDASASPKKLQVLSSTCARMGRRS
jgi:hypothetical protein